MVRVSALRYALVFSDGTGAQSPVGGVDPASSNGDVVIVERTAATGPGGHPVYADATGIIRAEISDQAEVRILASGGHQDPPRGVVARRLD